MKPFSAIRALIAGLVLAVLFSSGDRFELLGQLPAASASSYEQLLRRVERQDWELQAIRQQLDQQARFLPNPNVANGSCAGCGPEIWRLPVVAPSVCCPTASPPDAHILRYEAVYDEGFLLRPLDARRHPFALRVNGRIQFRYSGFARDVETWTDNAGITRPVLNRSNFEIERARLIFSGYAFSPRLTYFLQMDGDSDDREIFELFDYWWAWEFSDAFTMQMGKRKVPASRQWLLSSADTRLVDRPMACDFFRPDRTIGIFGIGRFGDLGHYEVMLGNGYRTANLPPSELDDRLTFAGTQYWDPFGDFGDQIVDFSSNHNALARVGHSFVYSPGDQNIPGEPTGEADFVRLTDGTKLTEPGALAPGVTVSQFDVYLYGVDLAMKWRGWSIDTEVFFRWIEAIEADGPLTITNLFQRGFYVEGGRFLVPSKFDINVRYSQIDGFFGNASSYAAGCNWYPGQTPSLKISLDATKLNSSPLNNTSSNILVGEDGMLYRGQLEARF